MEERDKLRQLFVAGLTLKAICHMLQRPASGVLSKLDQAKLITYNPGDSEYYVAAENEPCVAPTQPNLKEKTMSTNITITTKHLVGGTDTAQLSDAQIFQLIARKEQEVRAWEEINARPKKLQALIDEAKADIQKLVEFVDSRA